MKDNVKTAIDESIKHWERMLVWAKKEVAKNEVDPDKMLYEIHEYWYGDCCPLCALFYYNDSCNACPIVKVDYECGGGSLSQMSMWRKVSKSSNWGDWVKNAKEFLKLLKSLKDEED